MKGTTIKKTNFFSIGYKESVFTNDEMGYTDIKPTEEFIKPISQTETEVPVFVNDPHTGNEDYTQDVNVHTYGQDTTASGVDNSTDENAPTDPYIFLPKSEDEKRNSSLILYIVLAIVVYFLIK